jgi:IS1 family transposase
VNQKFFHKKTQLLQSLIENLEKEEILLLRGDAFHALQWEEENQKVLSKLIQLDRKMESESDTLPFSESEIVLSSGIFSLLKKAREIQERVQSLLEKERDTARNELNEVAIRRQLKKHLRNSNGLSWNKRIC